MGKRSAAEIVIAILTAFIEQRTWTQASLARHVGIGVPALRKHLTELSRRIPLEDEREHPHVVWSLANAWCPAGVVVGPADAHELLRQLARAPASKERDRLLLAIASASHHETPAGVAAIAQPPSDEAVLRTVEDACTRRVALTARYYSANSGHIDTRTFSVQRVLVGPAHRIVAHCHRHHELRYFRVSRIASPHLDESTPFVAAEANDVDAFISTSVDGFRDPSQPVAVSFVVRDPEARWVKDTLPIPMHVEVVPNGIRASATIAAVTALARYVVGLGEAAHPETPELATAINNLARGALLGTTPPIRSVTPSDSTDSANDVS